MKIERLNEWNKDMEFRLLAIYYTGVIAFSIGMPLEKIRAILGSEVKSTTGGSDIGNTDYQRNVYDMQEDWEDLLNTQFFNEEFGVDLRLERTAARDEAAEGKGSIPTFAPFVATITNVNGNTITINENWNDIESRVNPTLNRGIQNPRLRKKAVFA